MVTWQIADAPQGPLQILQFGNEPVGEKARWGPGRRNFYIVHYVLEGIGWFNGVPVEKGQGFLINPMKSVQYYPDPERPWKYFWVSFSGSEAERLCKKYVQTDDAGIFFYDFWIELTQMIKKLYVGEKTLGQMHALSLFYQLMSYHEAHVSLAGNRYVDEAMKFVDLNFHRQITVKEIASACGINDRYLYNLFVKHMGISPKQHLNRVRLHNAQQLLSDSNCNVTEAAVSVGFDDVLAFSRFFSKHMGMSPTAFRDRRRV